MSAARSFERMASIAFPAPWVSPGKIAAEDLDDVPADFLLEHVGPHRAMPPIIGRHKHKPVAEDAAQSLDGVEAGGSAAAKVAYGIGVADGAQGDLSVGESGLVDEIEEALSQAHAGNRSSPEAPLTGIVSSAKRKGFETWGCRTGRLSRDRPADETTPADEASHRHRERDPVAGLAPQRHHHRMRPIVQVRWKTHLDPGVAPPLVPPRLLPAKGSRICNVASLRLCIFLMNKVCIEEMMMWL